MAGEEAAGGEHGMWAPGVLVRLDETGEGQRSFAARASRSVAFRAPRLRRDRAAFALSAWRVAFTTDRRHNSSYVKLRPDLRDLRVEEEYQRVGWNVMVDVPLLHRDLAVTLPTAWGDWEPTLPHRFAALGERCGLPVEVYASATACVQLPATMALPAPPRDGVDPGPVAVEAVRILVREINAVVGPVVAKLGGGA
ncbi:hypothetical protein ACH4VR_36160 [Streptomyces sp. NPDC020883]|uniref:hypothetical protein n=1 Tax=Streptomyces sp. NPDC020883 TaxID=3365099 RepID=UPI003789B7BC